MSRQRRVLRALAVAAILWVAIVMAAYFAWHKPWTPDQLRALGSLGAVLAGLVGSLALALAIGDLFAGRLPITEPRPRFYLSLDLGVQGGAQNACPTPK